MSKSIGDLFVYLSFGSDFLILLIFIILFKKCKSERGLWIAALSAFFAILINYIINYTKIEDGVFYSLFTFVEYYLFSYFLYINIANKKMKLVIGLAAILFTAFLILYNIFVPYKTIDSIPIGVEAILILIFSFYFFYGQINDLNNEVIYNKYQFWIVTGIMVYLAGSFFIYVLTNQVDQHTVDQVWFLTNVFYIIKNILFAIGIFKFVKLTKNQHSKNTSS